MPFSALLTTDSIPKAFRKQHKQTTVHALLASFLTSGGGIETPWASTWPTLADFRELMPICWRESGMASLSEELLNEPQAKDGILLPVPPAIEWIESRRSDSNLESSSACGLLPAQRRKLRADWTAISGVLPETPFESYLYNWLVVNTRSSISRCPTSRSNLHERIAWSCALL